MTTTDQTPPPVHGHVPDQDRPVLRRSQEDRVLFGVCGGIGRYFGIDPVLVRLAFVLLVVFGGSGVLLYLIGLVVIPAEVPGEPAAPGPARFPNGAAIVLGALLVTLGALQLASRTVPVFGDLLGPLVLVSLGVVVIMVGRR